jgi:hypothetical protein
VWTEQKRGGPVVPKENVMSRKIKSIKVAKIWANKEWIVRFGWLNQGRNHPKGVPPLFKVLGEKLPFEALPKVDKHLRDIGIRSRGVYLAHDSMGYARYIGRGRIFPRLRACFKRHGPQLKYFSFYVVENRKHEGEIETLLIRAASPLLEFNTKKKKITISTGGFLDYEAGTQFFERRPRKGKTRVS